jgi:hypothetical protein
MWLECVDFSEKLTALYPEPPALDEVYLHEVRLHQDGPHLVLRFDLKTCPPTLPAKGVGNTIQVTLELWGISSINIRDFDTENHVRIRLERVGRQLNLMITGTTTISAIASNGFIQKVSVYHQRRPEE